MARYTIWVLGESDISLTGGVTLDGITQGDGSHLVGESLTINALSWQRIDVKDNGPDSDFDDNDGSQRLEGAQTIDGVSYGNATQIEAEYQFVLEDSATGERYQALAVNLNNSGPTYATNEAVAFVDKVPPAGVALRVVSASEGPGSFGEPAIDEARIVPLCLVAGTRVETPAGPRAVEALQPGDVVCTATGGHAVLRRVFRRHVDQATQQAEPTARPIRIAQGAMGCGLPRRPLRVSRQHRMVVSSPVAERMFGARDVFVAAIRLTALPGITVEDGMAPVTYFHLLFDRHHVILAEGTPTETLFAGPEALKAVDAAARREILALYPQIADGAQRMVPALPIPSGALQKRLVARLVKNGKQPLDPRRADRQGDVA